MKKILTKILDWFVSVLSEKNKDGKLVGSSKRVSGMYFTGLFTYISFVVVNAKQRLPNADLIGDVLEYTFYFIIFAMFGISALGIVGKVRNKNIITGNTDANIEITQNDTKDSEDSEDSEQQNK